MPQLISLVIYDTERVDEVIEAWEKAGITGFTLIESTGLVHHLRGKELRDDLPLFPSVRSLLEGNQEENRLLMSVVDDTFDIDGLIRATEGVLGPLDEPGTGILFVVPVVRVVGLQPRPDPDR
jgi:nitrogen regulatory protein PII